MGPSFPEPKFSVVCMCKGLFTVFKTTSQAQRGGQAESSPAAFYRTEWLVHSCRRLSYMVYLHSTMIYVLNDLRPDL